MAARIVSKINEPLLFRRRDSGPGASMVTMGFILDHELVFREREDFERIPMVMKLTVTHIPFLQTVPECRFHDTVSCEHDRIIILRFPSPHELFFDRCVISERRCRCKYRSQAHYQDG